ncbi:ATP-binding cassette domain-containing protein [Dermabacteraceae bacterium P13115]
MNTPPPAAELTEVTIKRGNTLALTNVTCTIPTGYVTLLAGDNGAGKSTLIRSLVGDQLPLAGTVEVLGKRLSPTQDVPPPGIVVVPDAPFYPASWDTLALMRNIPNCDISAALSRLERYHVKPNKGFAELSAGQATQAMLSVALATPSRFLVLDEPLARLDPLARDMLVDELREYLLKEDRTILISSHDISEAENFADHLILLSRGRVVLTGDLESLADDFLLAHVPEGEDASLLFGARTRGGWQIGLCAADDAPGLPSGSKLSRPSRSELVIHTLRSTL